MSAKTAPKLVPYRDFTHYLSVPIVIRSPNPQLHASFARFERETAAIVPKGSVLSPDLALFNLGRLKLKSKQRIDACSKHLHGLDMHEMLRDAAVNAVGGLPNFTNLPYRDEASHAYGVATTIDLSPLKVDVSGLFSMGFDPSQTMNLSASVIDRTHRLPHFQHLLLHSLFKAKFLADAFHPKVHVVNTFLPSVWLRKCTYNRRNGRWRALTARPPVIDARDLIQRWKDYDWATDVQLEKLSIHPLGSREKLPGGGARETQVTEVDSIILPRSHDINSPSELAGPSQ